MFKDIANQFVNSAAATECIQKLTRDHNLPQDQAQNAVRATAESGAEVMDQQGFDLNKIMGAIGGMTGTLGQGGQQQQQAGGGGLPADLVRNISDKVAQKTGISPGIASTVVNLVLPKVLEYAKGRQTPV